MDLKQEVREIFVEVVRNNFSFTAFDITLLLRKKFAEPVKNKDMDRIPHYAVRRIVKNLHREFKIGVNDISDGSDIIKNTYDYDVCPISFDLAEGTRDFLLYNHVSNDLGSYDENHLIDCHYVDILVPTDSVTPIDDVKKSNDPEYIILKKRTDGRVYINASLLNQLHVSRYSKLYFHTERCKTYTADSGIKTIVVANPTFDMNHNIADFYKVDFYYATCVSSKFLESMGLDTTKPLKARVVDKNLIIEN